MITLSGQYIEMGLYSREGLRPIKDILREHGLTLPLYPTGSGWWAEPWHMTERRYPG